MHVNNLLVLFTDNCALKWILNAMHLKGRKLAYTCFIFLLYSYVIFSKSHDVHMQEFGTIFS